LLGLLGLLGLLRLLLLVLQLALLVGLLAGVPVVVHGRLGLDHRLLLLVM
jgi:hypothetical protein